MKYNAFVTFANKEVRDSVIDGTHELEGGKWLTVTTPDNRFAASGKGKGKAAAPATNNSSWGASAGGGGGGGGAAPGTQLFVGGLPKDLATEDSVYAAFEQFGEITKV